MDATLMQNLELSKDSFLGDFLKKVEVSFKEQNFKQKNWVLILCSIMLHAFIFSTRIFPPSDADVLKLVVLTEEHLAWEKN